MTRRRAILQVRSHQARIEAAQEQREAETPPVIQEDEPELDEQALAAEYEELFDRKPGNMKPETMAERIAAKKAEASENDDAE